MRTEFLKALELSRTISEDEAQKLLHTLYNLEAQLIKCINAKRTGWNAFIGTSTSVEVENDQNHKNYIVIELTQYGLIASVFQYGTVPKEIMWDIESCILVNFQTVTDTLIPITIL